jgi:hypothetical protein
MTGLDPMWQCFAVALAAWTQRKLRCWGPGMVQIGAGLSRYGPVGCIPTMTGLKSPFASPESQAPDSLPRLGRPTIRWVIPSNIPTSKKTRKNPRVIRLSHEHPMLFPWL